MGDYNQLEGTYEAPTVAGPLRLRNRVTNRIKAQYEDWLEGRARRRVFELRDQLEPKEFEESLAEVTRACAAGTLSWGGDAWASSLQQLPGIVQLICLLSLEPLDEDQVLTLMQDAASVKVLTEAVQAILRASPNFMSPPVRGRPPKRSNRNGSGPSSGMRPRDG